MLSPTLAHTIRYTTLSTNDQKENSPATVACSSGEHGLLTHGYKTFGDLPTYPRVGGAPQILSWNLQYCGTCWELTYTDAYGAHTALNFTAVNTGIYELEGFSISLESMDVLTNGNALYLDGVTVTATRISKSACGLWMQFMGEPF